MCYHRPAAAGVVGLVAIGGAWAIQTHRAATTTVLGATVAVLVVACVVLFMAAALHIRAEHLPENIVEHGHHHPREHPTYAPPEPEPVQRTGWPYQGAWEAYNRGRAGGQ